MIDFEDFEKYINSISLKEWKPLFALLPKINQVGNMTRAMNIVYKLDLTPVFNWSDWKQGKEIIDNPKFDFTALDKMTLCKLLTFIVRANRFNGGYLTSCINDGTMGKILINLKRCIILN